MTPQHKAAISQGIKRMQERRRRSTAMKESYARRRNHSNNSIAPAIEGDKFVRIESLVRLWKGLEAEKTWALSDPEVMSILDGAVTRLRLEIILVARSITK